jgi:hypothetical protein
MRSSSPPIILVIAAVHPTLDNLSWAQPPLQTVANRKAGRKEGRRKNKERYPFCCPFFSSLLLLYFLPNSKLLGIKPSCS